MSFLYRIVLYLYSISGFIVLTLAFCFHIALLLSQKQHRKIIEKQENGKMLGKQKLNVVKMRWEWKFKWKKISRTKCCCVSINKNECEKVQLTEKHTQYKRWEKKYKTKIWKIRIKVKFFGRQRLWRHHQNRRTKRRDIFFDNIILFSFHPAYTHERPESASAVLEGGESTNNILIVIHTTQFQSYIKVYELNHHKILS